MAARTSSSVISNRALPKPSRASSAGGRRGQQPAPRGASAEQDGAAEGPAEGEERHDEEPEPPRDRTLVSHRTQSVNHQAITPWTGRAIHREAPGGQGCAPGHRKTD